MNKTLIYALSALALFVAGFLVVSVASDVRVKPSLVNVDVHNLGLSSDPFRLCGNGNGAESDGFLIMVSYDVASCGQSIVFQTHEGVVVYGRVDGIFEVSANNTVRVQRTYSPEIRPSLIPHAQAVEAVVY